MSAITLRDLRARRGHHIGHRALAEGEVLCRLQFRSDDDAKFFGNHLRWSAFELAVVDENGEPKPVAPAQPAAKTPAPAKSKPASKDKPVVADVSPVSPA